MRPTEQRTISSGSAPCAVTSARCGHLTVEKVTALTARPSTAGTRYPLQPSAARPSPGNAERGYASVTIAMLA